MAPHVDRSPDLENKFKENGVLLTPEVKHECAIPRNILQIFFGYS
jgi:hypothetical protein